LATFGFFDALSIFSSTLILMMSSTMKYKTHEGDHGAVDFSLNLLKYMRDNGNLPAHDYYKQLKQLKRDLDHTAQQMNGNVTGPEQNGHRNNFHLAQNASSNMGDLRLEAGRLSTPSVEWPNVNGIHHYNMGDVLRPSALQAFIAQQPDEAFTLDEDASFPPIDFTAYGDLNFFDASLYGTL
jgi:hypothetical protein